LDDTPASVWLESHDDHGGPPFGSALHSLDPLCPIANVLGDFLNGTASRNATILFLGDSLDAQILDFVCGYYSRTHNNTKRWFAFVHSHNVVNYCRIHGDNASLTLVQMYLLRYSLSDDMARVDVVQRFFSGDDSDTAARFGGANRTALEGRLRECAEIAQRQPDLIVVGGVYWALHRFTEDASSTAVLLPVNKTKTFVHETVELCKHIEHKFDSVPIAMRNSPEIRTDLHTGSNLDSINKRTWGRKSYVDALNKAIAQVSSTIFHNKLYFDLYSFGSTFQPMQLTADDIHPRAWFQFEMLNLYLHAS
jgi:hypothetical protein